MRYWQNEQNDTAKSNRTPNNMFEFFQYSPSRDEFIRLLVKHNKSIEILINGKSNNSDLSDAVFVIWLNNFEVDLVKVAKLCSEINFQDSKYAEKIKKVGEVFDKYNPVELMSKVSAFYKVARNYDENFDISRIFYRCDGSMFNIHLMFLSSPFSHDKKLSNEGNICKLVNEFNAHESFFKNFLNILYGDEEKGENFLNKKFGLVYSDYVNIKREIDEISKIIPHQDLIEIKEKIKLDRDDVERILKKYPATLYLATGKILNYLENSTETSSGIHEY